MTVIHKIRMDLAKKEGIPRIDTAQDDKLSRVLEFRLYTGEAEWPVPEGSTAVVRFTKPDGTGGSYDTLPDGTAACTVSGSTVTVTLAPQVCTAPGLVQLAVCLIRGEAELNTFETGIHVHGTPGMEEVSDGYYRVAGSLAASGWPPNMALGTDENGNVVAGMGAAGASPALRSAIYNLLMDAAYQSANHEADRAALEELLTGGGSDGEDEVTLTGISAAYSGGDAAVGTAVAELTGVVVTAHYSDGSQQNVTGYTLSGTIAEGSNTITVTYQELTTTFTVVGVASAPETNGWEDGVPYVLTIAESGKYVNGADGTIKDDAGYSVTDFLPCRGASNITLDTPDVYWDNYNAFYGEDKAFISKFGLGPSVPTVQVPENAWYVRLSSKTSRFTDTIITPHA